MGEEFKLEAWLSSIMSGLKAAFGDRLVFVAHAGSWARGEATQSSDIDINVVLDEVTSDDIAKYRHIIAGMPFREKACGFICGKNEICAWPRNELFHFMNGCNILHGGLAGIVEPPTKAEVAQYLVINASAMLHFTRHTLIYSPDLSTTAEMLPAMYKSVFFMLQAKVFLETGNYVPSKKLMAPALSDRLDREVFAMSVNWNALAADEKRNPEKHWFQLAEWANHLLLFADAYCAKHVPLNE